MSICQRGLGGLVVSRQVVEIRSLVIPMATTVTRLMTRPSTRTCGRSRQPTDTDARVGARVRKAATIGSSSPQIRETSDFEILLACPRSGPASVPVRGPVAAAFVGEDAIRRMVEGPN